MYDLEFSPAAARDMERLARHIQADDYRALRSAIEALREEPRPTGTVKLASEEGAYRVRVRRYRVIYHVDDRSRLVTLLRVVPRSQAYR